ncbi:MAG TPA: choice-of-anchor B family protein [Bacteroidia bacterium]|jgi:choice-of-anchor B domain-containing protein|nr:choice-of-anchor B family protein [Bacteroidia bacterium]
MKKLLFLLCISAGSLFSQSSLNVTFAANYPYGSSRTCANICGYVDSTGREYALIGVDNGMTVVDVTVPAAPVQIYQVMWPVQNSNSEWKEIKVYKKHAYVVSEAGHGVQIVDLSKLPSPTPPAPVYWQPVINGQTLSSIHALHIDTTKGNIYLYGSNVGNKGAIIGNLTNPVAPVYLGKFDNTYVHDGYVDNDTLYACEIYDGNMEIIDCSNKTTPVVLATVQTPLRFTHNSWLSPDKKTVFTTDEKTKSDLTSYDITNLANITLLDTIKGLSTGSIVHNVHVRKDYFAVTSWYRDGFTIVDVSRPNNLIMTGYYDMYAGSGNGFNGTWGVYPFLPSGTIICSNIEDGLYVFNPTYIRACYLEGNVKDSSSLLNLQGVAVQILTITNSNTLTDVSGNYATGGAAAGVYNVQFSKTGYQTKIINNVSLSNGVVTVLNTKLAPLGMGIAVVQNEQSFFNTPTIFENKTNLKYYLANAEANNSYLRVYDYSGNIVMEKKLDDLQGEIILGEGWAKGMYLVSLNSARPVRIIKAN